MDCYLCDTTTIVNTLVRREICHVKDVTNQERDRYFIDLEGNSIKNCIQELCDLDNSELGCIVLNNIPRPVARSKLLQRHTQLRAGSSKLQSASGFPGHYGNLSEKREVLISKNTISVLFQQES